MKLRHLKVLRPVCPRCAVDGHQANALKVGFATCQEDDVIIEGALQCTGKDCLCEFPIIDGVPILVPDPQAYIADNLFHLTARQDLSEAIESMLGECAGPGSAVDATRQRLSSYTWDHYGDFDPLEPPSEVRPGSVVRVLAHGLSLLQKQPAGPAIDVGCSVGRTTFELAQHSDELALGVDLNFSMLRAAANVLRYGTVQYARRRVGLVYERRQFPVAFTKAANVDFWACDVTAPPFLPDTFATAVGMNVLDSTCSPLELLRSLCGVLRPQGQLLLSTPYDWSGAVTPPQAWIGGHSPRAAGQGASESVLRALLTPGGHVVSVDGLALFGEADEIDWHVRVHDRHVAHYKCHLVTARRVEPQPDQRT